jgi:hypothetical protein
MNQIPKRFEGTVIVSELPAIIRDRLGLPADQPVRVTAELDTLPVADRFAQLGETIGRQAKMSGLSEEILSAILAEPAAKTAFDAFGSDLPDEVFEGVFDQPRELAPREVEL